MHSVDNLPLTHGQLTKEELGNMARRKDENKVNRIIENMYFTLVAMMANKSELASEFSLRVSDDLGR